MQVRAIAKYLMASPRKLRRIAAAVNGRPAPEALAVLRFLTSPTARTLAKVVRSAVANAENNYNLNPRSLVVRNIVVDQGPSYKRIQPKARGQWGIIKRRTSHVTVIVEDRESA